MAVLTSSELVDACTNIGSSRGKTGVLKTLMLAFLGGAFIGFGGLLMATVVAGLPKTIGTISKFVGGALFPVGLILVILGGADLFTGNWLYYVAGLTNRKLNTGSFVKSSVLSFVGNLLGAMFIAYIAIASGLLSVQPWLGWIQKLAVAKTQLPFAQAFWRGVGCNWLVCLACWMALASDQVTGKILGIWVSVMAFVTMGFEHSIANMFFIPAGMWLGAHVTWMQFWLNNELPVTLGNIVGGGLFVGLIFVLCHGDQGWIPRLRLRSALTMWLTRLF